MAGTTTDALRAVFASLDALESTAGSVEDEVQYVVDLHAVWRGQLERAAQSGTELTAEQSDAIAAAIAEARMISDPHRAIDWLSTLPQLVLAILGTDAR